VSPTPEPFWHPGTGDRLPDGIAGTKYALIVGVREARKNAALAIEACARALRPGELLVVAGKLNERDRLRATELGVNAGEIAPGDATLRALYRNATVVLVPSTAEGFGLVAMEALACGAPVIAANAAALPEATSGAAELLDPHDADAWARAIRSHFDRARATAPAPHPLRESFAREMLKHLRSPG
jgi:glycosyltransferase involved in cell wall biosynthesis